MTEKPNVIIIVSSSMRKARSTNRFSRNAKHRAVPLGINRRSPSTSPAATCSLFARRSCGTGPKTKPAGSKKERRLPAAKR